LFLTTFLQLSAYKAIEVFENIKQIGGRMKELTLQEQHILLAVFHMKDDAYLLSIRDYILETTGKDLAIGTVYVPLERLRRLGYLNVHVAKPTSKVGGRSTKYYRLTESGHQALTESKRRLDRLWKGFSPAPSSK
jgi:DNA-binding PadR family transcriptional regulator